MSTHDLIGQGLTLITGPGGDAWLDAATKVAAGTPFPITAHVVGADLDSADGTFCERFGLGSDGAVLVRPDGHIAWRREAGDGRGSRRRASRGRRRGDRLRRTRGRYRGGARDGRVTLALRNPLRGSDAPDPNCRHGARSGARPRLVQRRGSRDCVAVCVGHCLAGGGALDGAVDDRAVPGSQPHSRRPPPAPSNSGAAKEVLDAALATLAEETLRFKADVRSADPDDSLPAVTGTGQVSFGDPSQFRFASPGWPGTVPASEVIYDGERVVHARSRHAVPPGGHVGRP